MASEVFRCWGASFAEIVTVLRSRVSRSIVICIVFRLVIAFSLLLSSRDVLPSLVCACVTTLVFVDIRELLSVYSAAVLVAPGRRATQCTAGGLSQSIFEVTLHFVLMVGYVFVLLTIAIESLHNLALADSPRAEEERSVESLFSAAVRLLLLHVACRLVMRGFVHDPRLCLPTRRRAPRSNDVVRVSQWLVEEHAAVPLGTLAALLVVGAADIAGPVADVMTTMLLETWQITFVVRHLQQTLWILAGGEASQHCPNVHQFRCVLERELLMIRGVSHVLEWNTHVTASRYDGPAPEVTRIEVRVHLRVSPNSQSHVTVTREAKALLQRQDQWVDAAFVSTEEGTSGWGLENSSDGGSRNEVSGGARSRGTLLSTMPLPALPPPPPMSTFAVAAPVVPAAAVERMSSPADCCGHHHDETHHRQRHGKELGAGVGAQQSAGALGDRFAI